MPKVINPFYSFTLLSFSECRRCNQLQLEHGIGDDLFKQRICPTGIRLIIFNIDRVETLRSPPSSNAFLLRWTETVLNSQWNEMSVHRRDIGPLALATPTFIYIIIFHFILWTPNPAPFLRSLLQESNSASQSEQNVMKCFDFYTFLLWETFKSNFYLQMTKGRGWKSYRMMTSSHHISICIFAPLFILFNNTVNG